jgi:hypothetical protein
MMIQRRKFGTSDTKKTLEPSQDGIYHEMTFCFRDLMTSYTKHLGKEFRKYVQGLVYHPQKEK